MEHGWVFCQISEELTRWTQKPMGFCRVWVSTMTDYNRVDCIETNSDKAVTTSNVQAVISSLNNSKSSTLPFNIFQQDTGDRQPLRVIDAKMGVSDHKYLERFDLRVPPTFGRLRPPLCSKNELPSATGRALDPYFGVLYAWHPTLIRVGKTRDILLRGLR